MLLGILLVRLIIPSVVFARLLCQNITNKRAEPLTSRASIKKRGWSRLNIINDAIESIDFAESVHDQHSMAHLLEALRKPHAKSVMINAYASVEATLQHIRSLQGQAAPSLDSPFLSDRVKDGFYESLI